MNLILFDQNEVSLKDNRIHLPPDDIRAVHLKTILNADTGTVFDAGIINGKKGKAEITAFTGEGITVIFRPEGALAGLHPVSLILGLSRPPTIKKILKEATALGIARFILCGTETGERSYRDSSVLEPERTRAVLIEGAQQACCTFIPEVRICFNVKKAVETAGNKPHLIALDNYEAELSLTEYWRGQEQTNEKQKPTVLAVGSERGWTGPERDIFREAGYTLCSLGTRVLRTETASIAGTAVCLSGMGLI